MDGITTQEKAQSRIYRMRWWTLVVVSVTVLLATIDETILNVAIPSLQRDLGASVSSLQWMVNSYMLVFGGLLLTMGGVGDRNYCECPPAHSVHARLCLFPGGDAIHDCLLSVLLIA